MGAHKPTFVLPPDVRGWPCVWLTVCGWCAAEMQATVIRMMAMSTELSALKDTPRKETAEVRALQVRPFLAGIGSPCLRHCVHGAPIGGGGAARA